MGTRTLVLLLVLLLQGNCGSSRGALDGEDSLRGECYRGGAEAAAAAAARAGGEAHSWFDFDRRRKRSTKNDDEDVEK